MNEEIINEALEGYITDANELTHGWCMFIRGKVFNSNGRFIYPTKSQLTKAFYNSIRWRILWKYRSHNHISWGDNYNRSLIWKDFKKTLLDRGEIEIKHI